MKLLLVVLLASQKCQEAESGLLESATVPIRTFEDNIPEYDFDYISPMREPENGSVEYFLTPNITVHRRIEDREPDNLMVLCMFDRMLRIEILQMEFLDLSVESELNYTKEVLICISLHRKMCVFNVTVSPPASFTCVHTIKYNGEVKNLHSQIYTHKRSVLDHREEGVSLFYICFSSSIAVGLVIMTVAVIVTTIRSRTKDNDQ